MTRPTPKRRILDDRHGVTSSAVAEAHGAILFNSFIRVVPCCVTHPGLASKGEPGRDV